MVLIVSEDGDVSTLDVIDWLDYFKVSWIRINESSEVKFITLFSDIKKGICWEVEINDYKNEKVKLCSNEITGYWYRRGHINLLNVIDFDINPLAIYLKDNVDEIENFINISLCNKGKSIGSFYDNYTNKLYNLESAQKVGLNIPDTKIVTQKKDLINFFNKNRRIVTKGVKYNSFGVVGEYGVGCYTSEINFDDLNFFAEEFAPSLVQELLDKFVEIRVFYLKGRCYSSAIFSQLNPKTHIDFRAYEDGDLPNRIVPFNIPNSLKIKIRKFMKQINLDTGSIDLVLTSKNEFYFLEVNPVGQFGKFSYVCNFEIEKIIAEALI